MTLEQPLSRPWQNIVGLPFSPDQFGTYVSQVQWTSWRPQFLVLHNTGSPTLAERPNGFGHPEMDILVDYYKNTEGWSGGPHLFIDDKAIWVFTPLTVPGIHSPSWNAMSLGIEMLGEYSTEKFSEGRGKLVQEMTISALATLSIALGFDPAAIRLHKEDPRTTHKGCPGSSVLKDDLLTRVADRVIGWSMGEHLPEHWAKYWAASLQKK